MDDLVPIRQPEDDIFNRENWMFDAHLSFLVLTICCSLELMNNEIRVTSCENRAPIKENDGNLGY